VSGKGPSNQPSSLQNAERVVGESGEPSFVKVVDHVLAGGTAFGSAEAGVRTATVARPARGTVV
jgi:hypothetical protein